MGGGCASSELPPRLACVEFLAPATGSRVLCHSPSSHVCVQVQRGGERGGVFPKQVFLLPYLSSLSQEVRQAHAARGRWGGDCKSTHEALVSSLPLPPPCCCHGNARSHRLTFPGFFFRQQLPPFALISPPIHGEQPPRPPFIFFNCIFKKRNSVDFLPCMSTWECEAGLGASA